MIARRAVLLGACLLAPIGCGADDGGDRGDEPTDERMDSDVTWDLSTPTTPTELGSRALTLVQADGPGEMSVRFPGGVEVTGTFRNIVGNSWGHDVTADPTAPITAPAPGSPLSDPDKPINVVEFNFPFAETADALVAAIDWFTTRFQIAPDEAAELAAFRERFESTVASNDGVIDRDDFRRGGSGSSIYAFPAEDQDGLRPTLRVYVQENGAVAATVRVVFDPG